MQHCNFTKRQINRRLIKRLLNSMIGNAEGSQILNPEMLEIIRGLTKLNHIEIVCAIHRAFDEKKLEKADGNEEEKKKKTDYMTFEELQTLFENFIIQNRYRFMNVGKYPSSPSPKPSTAMTLHRQTESGFWHMNDDNEGRKPIPPPPSYLPYE